MSGRSCHTTSSSRSSLGSWPIVALAASLAASVAFAQVGDESVGRDRLVATGWVEEHLADTGVLVVDLRPIEEYQAGHIPGAVHLPVRPTFQATDSRGIEGMLPDASVIAEALGELGATPETTIVFYDSRENLWSARALWGLSVYGHADARIMDGAWQLWVAEERPTTTEASQVMAASYEFDAEPNELLIASWEEVVASIDDPSKLVCDARSPEEYAGEVSRSARNGRVPGSSNVEWTQAVSETGEFLPTDDLREIYSGAGITADDGQTIYTLCQAGVRAAHTWFVLHHLLEYDDVRVYDASWTEYGNREDSPIDSR